MLSLSFDKNGFCFTSNVDGINLHFQDWSKTDDCIYYLPLSGLVDNGYAYLNGESCIVPYENIYQLDDDERMILGVPPLYEKALRLSLRTLLIVLILSTSLTLYHMLQMEKYFRLILKEIL